jgi:hypothetical protein
LELGDVDVVVVMVMAAEAECDESDSAIIVVLGSIETTASEMCYIESNGRWEIARVDSVSISMT